MPLKAVCIAYLLFAAGLLRAAEPIRCITPGRVETVAFSPDGKTVAAGGADRMVRIWEASNGKLLHELPVFDATKKEPVVTWVAFSPDGKMLAVRGISPLITFWDSVTGKKLDDSIPADALTCSIAFSPDGSMLAVVNDKSIVIWDLAAKKIITKFPQPGLLHMRYAGDYSTQAIFSPDATLLATNSGIIWKLATNEKVMSDLELSSRQIAFSPDGKEFLNLGGTVVRTAPNDKMFYGQIRQWNLGTKSKEREYTAKIPSIFFVFALNPDGKTIAAGGALDTDVELLDFSTLKLIGLLRGHTDQVVGLSFSPDGKKLASASNR